MNVGIKSLICCSKQNTNNTTNLLFNSKFAKIALLAEATVLLHVSHLKHGTFTCIDNAPTLQ